MAVVIETTLGDITVDLFTDERPIACLNFLKLCKLKYYNYNLFHTVEQGFIAQAGDPTGVGDGGSSIWGVVEGTQKRFFEAETLPKIHHSTAGLLSLVSAGKSLAGSQFFFTLGDNLTSLDGIHCVIGEVVEGHETLRKLNDAIVDEKFRPYQDIRITHTVILDDPFPNPRGLKVPSRSPSPTAERLQNGRIAADEDIDDTDGKTMEELQEMLAEREAKARATILEIVGDLPDADMAPPENVLFVCKLNPVTTDDDLEIIFSRFGVVKSCEVIRDKKSGDSLQYAFVEFEDQKSCEAAYFKMDNVLIDDRRIHVDFSQSVAKIQWRGKGRGVVGQEGRLDFNNLREGNKMQRGARGRVEYKHDNRHGDRRQGGSTERRKAREERHREQRERETAREERHHEQRKRETDIKRYRSRSRDNMSERGRDRHGNIYQRERSPRRNYRHTIERRRDEVRREVSRECDKSRRSTSERKRHPPERKELDRNMINKDRHDSDQTKPKERNLKRCEDSKQNKTKNSKRAKSSSNSSSSESDTDSTESSSTSTASSSSSDSDSSSSGDRKKRKKRKDKKHKKNSRSNKHKKSKKKHRK